MCDLFNKLASSKTNQMKNNTLNNLAALGQIQLNVAPVAKAPAQRQEPRQQHRNPQPRRQPVQQRRMSLADALYEIRMTDWESQWLAKPATEVLVFNPEIQQWEPTPKSALAEVKMSNCLWQEAPSSKFIRAEDPSRIQYVKKSPATLERIMIERGLCVPLTINGRNAGKADLVMALVADDAKERAERHIHLQASQSWSARNRKRADSKLKSLRARARSAGLSGIIRLKAERNGDQWMLSAAGLAEMVPMWINIALNSKNKEFAAAMQNGTGNQWWAKVHAKSRAEEVRVQQERMHSAFIARFKERAAVELLKGIVEEVKRQPKVRAGYSDAGLTEFYSNEYPLTLPEQVLAEFRHYADQQLQPPSLKPVPAQRGRQEADPVLVERIKRSRAEVIQDAYRKVQASPRLDGSRGRKQEYLAQRLVEAGAIADEPKAAVKSHAVKMVAAKPQGPLNLLEATVAQPRRLK